MRISDWSSDVCSSDLAVVLGVEIIARSAVDEKALARHRKVIAREDGRRDPKVAALAPGRDPIQRPEDVVLIGCKHRGRGGESPRHLGLRQRGGLHHHCDAERKHRYSACSHQFSRSEEHTSELQSLMRISYAA